MSKATETAASAETQNHSGGSASAGAAFRREERRCAHHGADIYGIAYIPETGEKKVPLVIISHELAMTHATGTGYAEALAARGIAAYIFDFPNGAHSSRSGSDMSKMSVMTEAADLEAVIETAKTWDFADPGHIVLMGGSQGGFVTAVTAARRPEEIAGVILLYPAFVIVDEVHELFGSAEKIPETFRYHGWFTAGRQYAADVWDYDTYRTINAYTKPLLILHGSRDHLVDVSYSENAAECYPAAELHVISGADHGFTGCFFEEAMGYIEGYLTRIGIL